MLEDLNINFMLIIVAVAAVCKMADGYKKGMTKEIISFISLIVLCIVGALIAGGGGYRASPSGAGVFPGKACGEASSNTFCR